MDFSKVKSLTIPEGVVTQITDASGRVLWAVQSNEPIVLQVEKITSDTYAGETTYTGEQFILLDVYPKTNGTVSVTYGGLTKTITDTSGAAKPNAQQVFFGTFNGVTDSVITSSSGELIIEGDCYAFGCSEYNLTDKTMEYCSCITDVKEWGSIKIIADAAFYGCFGLPDVFTIPSSIEHIGYMAFNDVQDETGQNNAVIDTVIMLSTTPPTIDSLAFGDAVDIIVPRGCGDAYKAVWSEYADYIAEAS